MVRDSRACGQKKAKSTNDRTRCRRKHARLSGRRLIETTVGMVRIFCRPEAVWLMGVLLVCLPARADRTLPGGPGLDLPIDCTVGSDCWIANYVDRDPGASARDYTCGHLTYDTHGGTDFAVRDLGAMRRGVAVLAAADGIVERVRDGVRDTKPSTDRGPRDDGRACGNGVFVAHGRGWTTQSTAPVSPCRGSYAPASLFRIMILGPGQGFHLRMRSIALVYASEAPSIARLCCR